MQELSTQSQKTESDRSYAQWVFKCHVSLACAKALSSKSKDWVRLPPRTTSLQVLHVVDICGGYLRKVERPSLITPTYNESSSARAYWNNPCTQQALKRINLQRNDHNTTKKKGERDIFGATIVHRQPKEIYINFLQEWRKILKKGQYVDTYKSKEVPSETSWLGTYDWLNPTSTRFLTIKKSIILVAIGNCFLTNNKIMGNVRLKATKKETINCQANCWRTKKKGRTSTRGQCSLLINNCNEVLICWKISINGYYNSAFAICCFL